MIAMGPPLDCWPQWAGVCSFVWAQLHGLTGQQFVAPDLLHLLKDLLVDALVQEGIAHICDDVLDHGMVYFELRVRTCN